MTSNDRWRKLQDEKPFLGGALLGLIFGIAMVLTDLIFEGEVNLVIVAVITPLIMLACSLLMGLSAKSRRKKSG